MPFTWRLLNTSLLYLVVLSDPQRGVAVFVGFNFQGEHLDPRHPGLSPEVRYLDPKNIRIKHRENLRRYGWMSKREFLWVVFENHLHHGLQVNMKEMLVDIDLNEISSWWLVVPTHLKNIENYWSNWIISPGRGGNKKCDWNHHLEFQVLHQPPKKFCFNPFWEVGVSISGFYPVTNSKKFYETCSYTRKNVHNVVLLLFRCWHPRKSTLLIRLDTWCLENSHSLYICIDDEVAASHQGPRTWIAYLSVTLRHWINNRHFIERISQCIKVLGCLAGT